MTIRSGEAPALKIDNSDVDILDGSAIKAKNARIFLDVTESFF